MLGFIVVNAFFALRHWKDPLADFKSEMDRLALRLMQNPSIDAPVYKSPQSARASPRGSPDGCRHQLIPLRNVEGIKWKNGMQQRCVMCNSHTTWVCGDCSTGPTCLVPLCPEATRPRKGNDRGKTIYHPCHGKHQCWPTYFPKGKREGRNKRARNAGGTDVAGEDDEDDEGVDEDDMDDDDDGE